MKQLVYHYSLNESLDELSSQLENYKTGIDAAKFFITIQSIMLDINDFEKLAIEVSHVFPNNDIIGYTTGRGIINCNSVENGTNIIFTVFEDNETNYKVFFLNKSNIDWEQSRHDYEDKKSLLEFYHNELAECSPWMKAVEFYHTTRSYKPGLLDAIINENNQESTIFGGILCDKTILTADGYLYCRKAGKPAKISYDTWTTYGLLGVVYGGPSFHVYSKRITGWQPLGRVFKVTKSDGNKIIELNGQPAISIYNKYLNITNDINFSVNTLEFPLIIEQNGITNLFAINNVFQDGTLELTTDIKEGSIVRLSYGETKTISYDIEKECVCLKHFHPDVIHLVSCEGRAVFYEDIEPSIELNPFKEIAPVSGYYSHGEIFKANDNVHINNLTIIATGFREGSGKDYSGTDIVNNSEIKLGRIPLATRLATFIRETSFELEETNSRLAEMNKQLQNIATIDSLTGLDNRFSFNEYVENVVVKNIDVNYALLMFDVNRLKYVNDTFGHDAGDILIRSAANAIQTIYGPIGKCFRVGGDEFVAIVNCSQQQLTQLEESFDEYISEYNTRAIYKLSIARGCSMMIDSAGNRQTLSDWKIAADLAMYRNKSVAHNSEMAIENNNLKQFISCLVMLEESKDSYTAYHSTRVCALSTYIAKKLNLSGETITQIINAARLHDIGKIGIQDSVLCKPGKLTANEFDVIKEHPCIGAKALSESNYTREFVDIVLHHHERYDGKGYPSGLKGEDIPIGARVIAIADSIDAMTSKRCYREAMTLDACKSEIERNLGVMYDPAIGRLVLDNWTDIENIVTSNPKRLV